MVAAAEGAPGVIAVLGVKGGVGASLVATGLAGELAPSRAAAVIDLDLYKGDIAGMLDLEIEHPVSAVTDRLVELDRDGLRGSAAHHAGGLWVLGQPESLDESAAPSVDEIGALVGLARRTWDTVVVDCGSRMDPQTLRVAMDADAVLLVTTTDVLALRDLIRVHTMLVRMGVSPKRAHVVLNRVDRHPEVPVDQVDDVTDLPILTVLHEDRSSARAAVHDGRPVPESAPGSTLARDLQNLWTELSGEQLDDAGVAPWWRRLLPHSARAS